MPPIIGLCIIGATGAGRVGFAGLMDLLGIAGKGLIGFAVGLGGGTGRALAGFSMRDGTSGLNGMRGRGGLGGATFFAGVDIEFFKIAFGLSCLLGIFS